MVNFLWTCLSLIKCADVVIDPIGNSDHGPFGDLFNIMDRFVPINPMMGSKMEPMADEQGVPRMHHVQMIPIGPVMGADPISQLISGLFQGALTPGRPRMGGPSFLNRQPFAADAFSDALFSVLDKVHAQSSEFTEEIEEDGFYVITGKIEGHVLDGDGSNPNAIKVTLTHQKRLVNVHAQTVDGPVTSMFTRVFQLKGIYDSDREHTINYYPKDGRLVIRVPLRRDSHGNVIPLGGTDDDTSKIKADIDLDGDKPSIVLPKVYNHETGEVVSKKIPLHHGEVAANDDEVPLTGVNYIHSEL